MSDLSSQSSDLEIILDNNNFRWKNNQQISRSAPLHCSVAVLHEEILSTFWSHSFPICLRRWRVPLLNWDYHQQNLQLLPSSSVSQSSGSLASSPPWQSLPRLKWRALTSGCQALLGCRSNRLDDEWGIIYEHNRCQPKQLNTSPSMMHFENVFGCFVAAHLHFHVLCWFLCS